MKLWSRWIAKRRLAQLRSALSAMEDWDWHQQVEKVEQLRPLYPHSIRPLGFGPPHETLFDRRREFNCLAYAFQLVVWQGFFEQRRHPAVKFTPTLAQAMLFGMVEKSAADKVDGDLVIYSNQTGIAHAGIVRGHGVHSKWGTGYAWEHGTLEIPAGYGSTVSYYASASIKSSVALFNGLAERQIDEFNRAMERT